MFKTYYTLLLLLISTSLISQNQLLSPSDFLPHQLGEQFTHHHQLVDYIYHVGDNSPNVEVTQYGMTNEDRPLILAYVTAPENMSRLEDIRQQHLSKTGMIKGNGAGENDLAIVWLSFNVHGNEAGSAESSMPVLYELANPDNKDTQEWLKNTVVLFDPCINPDGYSRYTHWYRNASNRLKNPHIESREHQEPWPGGRVNHYLFDLNRDWAWATQVESRQRLKVYNQWMPHIHVDFHEQFHNSPYYFAPAAQPYHEYLSQWQRDFQVDIGQNHAKYFDQNGWLYFTKEFFDLLYPSYGDTYPMFNGAIGMTYEQAGHGMSGRAILLENGDTLTLHDRIAHHKTTALSTVEVASKNAVKINREFEKYFKAAQENPVGKYKSYVIRGNNAQGKLKRLTELLDRHGIQYGTTSGGKLSSAFDYSTGRNSSSVYLTQKDLIISAFQPKSVLTQALFEPEPKVVDSVTYDITAWALPYAYGLQAYATTDKIEVNGEFKFKEYQPDFKSSEEPYAYAANWESMQNAQFLADLLQAGIKVRRASNRFSFHGKNYNSGTLLINKADNRKVDNFHQKVQKIAVENEQEINSIETGFASSGNDLGSSAYHFIKSPKVAVLMDEDLSPYSFGQVWYYFEQDLGYPVTILPVDNLNASNLAEYNTLVMPEGRYDFDDKTLETLSNWANSGGKLIAIGSAVGTFEDKKGFNLTKYATEEAKSEAKKAREKATLENRTQPYAGRNRRAINNFIPGAIFKVKMDNTHPLAYGFSNYYFSLKTSTRHYDLLKNTWNVGYLEEKPFSVGFAGAMARKNLQNTVNFAVQNKGGGSVIYLMDNPLYRSFWEEGKFLFSNAVFFVD